MGPAPSTQMSFPAASPARRTACTATARGSILVAVFAGMATVVLAVLNDHELDLNTSMMYRTEDYAAAIELVNQGKVSLVLTSVTITRLAPMPLAAWATRMPMGPAPKTAIFCPVTSPALFKAWTATARGAVLAPLHKRRNYIHVTAGYDSPGPDHFVVGGGAGGLESHDL